MWDRFLSDDAAQRMAASGCGAQIGNLVPWPLVRFWKSKLFSVKLDGCGCQIMGLFSEIFFLIKFWSTFKSWTNGLASQRKFSTCVQLAFSFGHPLAMTCDDFDRAQIRTQVFQRLVIQRKSTQVDRKSSVYAWNLRIIATCVNWTCESIRSATHHKSVYTQVLVLQTCVDLRFRLAEAFE